MSELNLFNFDKNIRDKLVDIHALVAEGGSSDKEKCLNVLEHFVSHFPLQIKSTMHVLN